MSTSDSLRLVGVDAPLWPPPVQLEFQQQVGTTELVATVYGAKALRAALRAGRWSRPHRGVIVTHNGPLTRLQQMWVALLASPTGSALGGPTAAELLGLKGFTVDQVHVVLPRGRHLSRVEGVRYHWSSRLTEDVRPNFYPLTTRASRAIVDMAAWCATDGLARAVLVASVQQRLTTPAELREALGRRWHCRRSSLIAQAIVDIEGGVQSIPELAFSRLIRESGLPEPTRQQVVRHRDGRRYYLDSDWPAFRVSAEVEGAHHMGAAQWRSDLDRHNQITAAGRRVLHFSSHDVRHEPVRVAELLRQALLAGGWSPG